MWLHTASASIRPANGLSIRRCACALRNAAGDDAARAGERAARAAHLCAARRARRNTINCSSYRRTAATRCMSACDSIITWHYLANAVILWIAHAYSCEHGICTRISNCFIVNVFSRRVRWPTRTWRAWRRCSPRWAAATCARCSWRRPATPSRPSTSSCRWATATACNSPTLPITRTANLHSPRRGHPSQPRQPHGRNSTPHTTRRGASSLTIRDLFSSPSCHRFNSYSHVDIFIVVSSNYCFYRTLACRLLVVNYFKHRFERSFALEFHFLMFALLRSLRMVSSSTIYAIHHTI